MSEDTSSKPAGEERRRHRYDAALAGEIEIKWEEFWERAETFHTPNPGEPGFDPTKPKAFVMDMFPYPSGVGLHVGHPLGYIGTDVYARFLRMTGHNVLHPMGYDAFGLPAEQFAIQTGQHPRVTTERNIATMKRQMRRLGLGHDPRRSLATTDVSFYRWTQWIFLQIFNSFYDEERRRARPISELVAEFESGARPPLDDDLNPEGRPWAELSPVLRRKIVDNRRLAYVAEVPVNWCPALGTVLANEEVTAEGRSERGDHPVYKRPLKQWMMRITAYAERLLEDLEPLEWPESIKIMQRNWIGRSQGAEVDFLALSAGGEEPERWFEARAKSGFPRKADPPAIRVYTTRPDTLYGATYMVLAPEHPLVDRLVPERWPARTPEAWKGRFPGRPKGRVSPASMVAAYRRHVETLSDVERQVETKEKTGVFIGAFAVNPVNREKIPIFVADYVLMGYGTGAIMAVPAHDHRDCEFALQFDLPIVPVVVPTDEWLREKVAPAIAARDPGLDASDPKTLREVYARCATRGHELEGLYEIREAFVGDGTSVNSPAIEGLPTPEAKKKITSWLAGLGLGREAVNYRLRDWLFSRQRYWGEPFPIVYDEHDLPVALEESQLPVELPELENYAPETSDDPNSDPRPPLARATDWASVAIDGKIYRRELNTMPNWAGSCWYYLRYLDPRNDRRMVDPEVERYWMLTPTRPGDEKPARYEAKTCRIGGVDLYVGGAEHAVLHLLYARFWHKVLYDLGHVSTPEPFHRLFNQGYVQAAAYKDRRGVYVEANEVEERDGKFYHRGEEVTREFGKMGKSLKNAVTPDEICRDYGADTLRLYEMYMGPLESSKPWNTRDIAGVYRFLQRLWRNLVDEETGRLRVAEEPASPELRRALHKTIDAVRRDMETLGFNTAIARLIELNNELTGLDAVPREVADPLIRMLAPLAPHVAEELWSRLTGGAEGTIAYERFPEADPALLVEKEVEVPVMIRGAVRARILVPLSSSAEEMERAALAQPRVQEYLKGKTIRRVVCVPDKIVNIVI